MKDIFESIKYGLTHNVPYLTFWAYVIILSGLVFVCAVINVFI